MTTVSIDKKAGWWTRIRNTLLHEVNDVSPPPIFFFVGLNAILLLKQPAVVCYLFQFFDFSATTVTVLIIGKVVLVTNKLPFLRRFNNAPLAESIFFKRAPTRPSPSSRVLPKLSPTMLLKAERLAGAAPSNNNRAASSASVHCHPTSDGFICSLFAVRPETSIVCLAMENGSISSPPAAR